MIALGGADAARTAGAVGDPGDDADGENDESRAAVGPRGEREARQRRYYRQFRMTKRGVTIAMAVAVALVIARSAVFLLWEQAAFDSDQAIFGLMAKHIAEGRAFPMFIYGDRYLMAVQAWLAAPLFLVFEPSVALLKLPVVLINAATAALLVFVLHRDAGLRPATALLASLFFAAMPPIMAKLLAETGGGNPEPFLYVLLLWVLRARPLAFGLVFAFGFVHREFTAYGSDGARRRGGACRSPYQLRALQSSGACRHRLLRCLASDPRRLPVFKSVWSWQCDRRAARGRRQHRRPVWPLLLCA